MVFSAALDLQRPASARRPEAQMVNVVLRPLSLRSHTLPPASEEEAGETGLFSVAFLF